MSTLHFGRGRVRYSRRSALAAARRSAPAVDLKRKLRRGRGFIKRLRKLVSTMLQDPSQSYDLSLEEDANILIDESGRFLKEER